MADDVEKVRGPIMCSDPEVLKAARHLRGQLAGAVALVEEKRRLAGAKAALVVGARGPKTLLAHGADAAAYAEELENAADRLAWLSDMVDALETSPENFVGLTAEDVSAGWRIVRDQHGAELKFMLEAGEGGPTESPNFNLLVMRRRTPGELWEPPGKEATATLVVPAARAALGPFMDKTPSRRLYLEMSRALQAALRKALRSPEQAALPEVVDRTGGERLFGVGDRVYHRRRDLFARVLGVWPALPGDPDDVPDVGLEVKFEWPWDPAAPAERLPADEFVPASAVRGN